MCQGEGTRATDTTVANRTQSDDINSTSQLVESQEPSEVKVKPWRTLKRALKATVGAGCVASAAVLLSNSDDLGNWLQSVAPRVMPNAEAGADIVTRAIEASKVCFEEGVNICLDAEGQFTFLYTYISKWYLSPQQHVIEAGLSILLLAPLVYLYFRVCRSRVRQHRAASTFALRRSSLLMKLWAFALTAFVTVGAYLKFAANQLISHPAYVWQPCHVHSFVMGLCTFIDTEWSLLVLHVATTLWWGPFLAFVAPSLPVDPVEEVIFWGQHGLMLLMPFFRMTKGGNWMYTDFWWNSVGFVFLTCYHWWWLAPLNILTGVNVATMTVPPDALVMLGKYYRGVWGMICITLQLTAVLGVMLLAWVTGHWPSNRRVKQSGSSTEPEPMPKPAASSPCPASPISPTSPVSPVSPVSLASPRGEARTPGDPVILSGEKASGVVDGE